ncbi:MAG TPA: hypothetical protein VFE64_08015 [Devosia sp.]|jgi:hypothetical protein|nr:hypothetical protein [Devosia sp.]
MAVGADSRVHSVNMSTKKTSKEMHMSRFPKLTTVIRSTVVALAIGGAAITAAPVQAAPPSIDFHFGFGGGGISIGGGRYCLSDRQVRFLLKTQGYDHIRFFDRRGRIVGVQAERRHKDYLVWVDTCRARIVEVRRAHRNNMFDGRFTGGGRGPGFSGSFSY